MVHDRPTEPGRRTTLVVLLAAIALPVTIAACLGEEVAEREPMAVDRGTLIAATPHAAGLWHGAMVGFSDIGAGLVPVLVASVAVTASIRRRLPRHALFVVLAVEGASVGGRLLKAEFERPRPVRPPGASLAGAGLADGRSLAVVVAALAVLLVLAWPTRWRATALVLSGTATAWLVVQGAWTRLLPLESQRDSFPSGHAVGSMALVAAVVVITWSTRFRWAALLAGSVFVVAVGTSRVYLGYHFPSDILAGWSFSIAWTAACWLLVTASSRVSHVRAAANLS